MTTPDCSASGYLSTDYEGISKTFTELTPLPALGYCDLFMAKRYGRWYLLKCLKAEHAADPVYQQMLRKEFEILMRLQHPSVMQAVGIERVCLPARGDSIYHGDPKWQLCEVDRLRTCRY